MKKGEEVARKVSEKLGYDCISRDILLEASKDFNVPEAKLRQAMDDVPSFFNMFFDKTGEYVNYMKTALLNYLRKDNIVYHGFAGHYFVRDVPHVLKVRINESLESRARDVMERDGVSYEKARNSLVRTDDSRKVWGKKLYDIDLENSTGYDLTFLIDTITVDKAVDMICQAIDLPGFQSTPEVLSRLEDLYLESQLELALQEYSPKLSIRVNQGDVNIEFDGLLPKKRNAMEEIIEKINRVPGVKNINVDSKLNIADIYE